MSYHDRLLLDWETPVADENADANITVVTTAEQFQAAVAAGVQDIQLENHVDLSNLNLPSQSYSARGPSVLGDVKPSTRSIRVSSLV